MWFIPYLRVRRAVMIYTTILVSFTVLAIAMRFVPHVQGPHSTGDPAFASRLYFDLLKIAVGTSAAVAGLATVLGLNLASENEGHLEVAWTKPVSRERYGLSLFGVDIVAIAIAQFITMACVTIVADVWIGHAAVVVRPENIWRDIAVLMLPINIYAWVTVLTASLKRNRGVVAGLLWPGMLGLAALAFIPVQSVQSIARIVDTINPIVMYTNENHHVTSAATYEIGLFVSVVLLALALVQWRRLEA